MKTRKGASLWAGYGSITEVTISPPTKDAASRAPQNRLILKRVSPPEKGCGESHARKVRSYNVEAAFYADGGPAVALARAGVPVPTPLAVSSKGREIEMLLTDLRVTHPLRFGRGSFDEAVAGLKLLAKIHAAFWESPLPDGLWPEGSYWRLDTRMDELAQTDDPRVVRSARAIDLRLRGIIRRDGGGGGGREERRVARRTLVHGDPKGDNLLLSEPGSSGAAPPAITAAAYDFQYCGGGLGVRDVAYFLCSAVDSRTLGAREDDLVAAYHAALLEGIRARGGGGGKEGGGDGSSSCSYPLEALRDDLDLAVADYSRFMAGWGYWGNSSWAEAKAAKCLDRIDGGEMLPSEDDYIRAVARAYPYPEY